MRTIYWWRVTVGFEDAPGARSFVHDSITGFDAEHAELTARWNWPAAVSVTIRERQNVAARILDGSGDLES